MGFHEIFLIKTSLFGQFCCYFYKSKTESNINNIYFFFLLSNDYNKNCVRKPAILKYRHKSWAINDLHWNISAVQMVASMKFLLETNVCPHNDNDRGTPFYIAFGRVGRPTRNQTPCTANIEQRRFHCCVLFDVLGSDAIFSASTFNLQCHVTQMTKCFHCKSKLCF